MKLRIPLEKLVQKGNKIFAEDAEGNSRPIAKLASANVRAFFEDDGFYTVNVIPYTNFTYNKYFDEEGKYLAEPTEERFMVSLIRDIQMRFIDNKKMREAFRAENINDRFSEVYDEFSDLSNAERVTYELLECIICCATEADFVDEISLASYRKVEKLLRAAGVEEDLELPIINICALNESGQFGRKSLRFCSAKIDKMLNDMLKTMGKDEFNATLYDPVAFHSAVEEYVNKVRK